MLDLKGAQEWVVTTKLGSSDKRPGTSDAPPRDCRFYAGEMAMSTFVLTAAFYGIFSINRWSFSIFLTLQGDNHILLLHGHAVKPSGVAVSRWCKHAGKQIANVKAVATAAGLSPQFFCSIL